MTLPQSVNCTPHSSVSEHGRPRLLLTANACRCILITIAYAPNVRRGHAVMCTSPLKPVRYLHRASFHQRFGRRLIRRWVIRTDISSQRARPSNRSARVAIRSKGREWSRSSRSDADEDIAWLLVFYLVFWFGGGKGENTESAMLLAGSRRASAGSSGCSRAFGERRQGSLSPHLFRGRGECIWRRGWWTNRRHVAKLPMLLDESWRGRIEVALFELGTIARFPPCSAMVTELRFAAARHVIAAEV